MASFYLRLGVLPAANSGKFVMPLIDILMITYNRPVYTERALSRLLMTCDDTMRVWIWHNGNDTETLEVAQKLSSHPNVERFHHSPDNRKLGEPTNWLWAKSTGDFVAKVDDDCLVEPGWAQQLLAAHQAYRDFGVLGSWRFLDDEFLPELAERKIREFPGGHRVYQNLWVQGSGYLMKKRCVSEYGLLRPGQSFSNFCIELAALGFVNGWYYPFIREEHMDDPRSPFTVLRTDEDLLRRLPLSARGKGITTLAAWEKQLRESAHRVQTAPLELQYYRGWRPKVRRLTELFQKAWN